MRSNVTKSSVKVAFGTNRDFACPRIVKSLCAFVLRQRNCAIAPLSIGELAWEKREGHVMPPRQMRSDRAPASVDGWYHSGRWVDLGLPVFWWQCSVN